MSGMSKITFAPKKPVDFFKSLLQQVTDELIVMNIATIDSEFGPLNRSVVYRCILDDAIVFITERDSRKYENLCKDKRISATITFGNLSANANAGPEETVRNAHWQVRLFDAYAEELNEQQIAKFWEEEPLFAKIRSHIMQCGKPTDVDKLQAKHDKLLQEFKNNKNSLPQTKTYTAFKIIAKRWDFYMAQENCIGDRLQYRKQADDKWEILHVSP